VFNYPTARRSNTTEIFHNKYVIDNKYDWMEDPDSAETMDFSRSQNKITQEFLKTYPHRNQVKARLESMTDYEKKSLPLKGGDDNSTSQFWYVWYNSGRDNFSILYQLDSPDDEISRGREFLNAEKLDPTGLTSISGPSFSPDGSICGYETSTAGSDWKNIHFRQTKTNENGIFTEKMDVLKNVKFSEITWSKDGKGVFYGAYPDQSGKTDGTETTKSEFQKTFYHEIGESQENDVLVADTPEDAETESLVEVSSCGKFIFKYVSKHFKKTLYFSKMNEDKSVPEDFSWTPISKNFDARVDVVHFNEQKLILKSYCDAPNGKLVVLDLEQTNSEANELGTMFKIEKFVAETDFPIRGTYVFENRFLLIKYMKDCKDILIKYDLATGEFLTEVVLPYLGSLQIGSDIFGTSAYMKLWGWVDPGSIYKYDIMTDEVKLLSQTFVPGFDQSLYQTTQIFHVSKDGTKVPMFLVHKKGLKLNSKNPTVLYGYGGFGLSLTPGFSSQFAIWSKDMNGVLAIANIRGGGEYGDDWHDAGIGMNKQNSFDDFQSGAEWLISNKYTSSEKLAIMGGSNGGLLVAACFNQRPDLFKAVICRVPVTDMLRFQRYTIGHAWQGEYNHPDDIEEEFLYNEKYSPLHNVRKIPEIDVDNGVKLPGMMIMTADHDDRVSPHHALKFGAEVQAVHGNSTDEPLLIRVEMDAGHGAGIPRSKEIGMTLDYFSFLGLQMQIEIRE